MVFANPPLAEPAADPGGVINKPPFEMGVANLCLLLCKSGLLRFYECYRKAGTAPGSGRPKITAGLPVHR